MFESEFAKTEYIERDHVVFHVWKKEAHFDDYRDPVKASLEMLREHEGSLFVVDARHGFEDVKEDVEWGFNYFLPELKKTGCTIWGFILPEISEIEGEIDLWTKEIEKNFRVIRATSYLEILRQARPTTENETTENETTANKLTESELTENKISGNIEITYKEIHDFSAEDLQELFLSVDWSSGHFPDRLVMAMKNYETVYTAWDKDKLIGLISAMDDGNMNAYVHYLLVHPDYHKMKIGRTLVQMVKEHYKDYLRIVVIAVDQEIHFYEDCGFELSTVSKPMFITSLWT